MHKVLVLYTELADYILNSFIHFANRYGNEVHIVHWPINSEAPFSFDITGGVTLYNKANYNISSLKNLSNKINPDAIICAGWMDKDYVAVSKKFFHKIPTILTMDNHWEGNLKQQVLRLVSPFYLKRIFSHIWVPGKPQKEYAMKLSFDEQQILTGFYVANENIFNNFEYQPEKTFIYVGRYIEHKGIKDLWDAFLEAKQEINSNWKLKCIGTGDLWNERKEHKDIEHLGFLQPKEIVKEIKGGVFVLPSHFEPWGVVVHEFAMAGFPMIVSDKVGAGTEFLNKNGYLFSSGSIEILKEKMKLLMLTSDEEFEEFSDKSKQNAKLISNDKWAEQLNFTLTNFKN